MKITLLEETFSIFYETAEFIFKEDQRIFFEIFEASQVGNTTWSQVVSSGLLKTLIEIKGMESEDGKKILPKDFFRLPSKIVAEVRTGFLKHVIEVGKTEKNEKASD